MAESKNPAAVALGRLGGKKGAATRAANMTPAERSESARKAAQARWNRRQAARRDATDFSDDNFEDARQWLLSNEPEEDQ